jgi:uncharacterized membrane protein YkoI
MQRRRLAKSILAVGVGVMTAFGAARADDADHDRARAALEKAEVLPLREILEKVEREYPGKVVEVELEREHDRWIYEIRLIRPGGALVRLEVDARDARVLGVQRRDRGRELQDGGER